MPPANGTSATASRRSGVAPQSRAPYQMPTTALAAAEAARIQPLAAFHPCAWQNATVASSIV